MMKIFSKRRNIIIAGVSTAVVIGSASAAFAYFAASGTGNGSASVGAAGTWNVAQTATNGVSLYPDGTSIETLTFTVTNTSSGQQEFTLATPSVPAETTDSNGYALDVNGNPVAGCKASWFTTSIAHGDDPSLSHEIAANGTATVTVSVKMPVDEADNQTACAGTQPKVLLNIS